MRATQTRSDAVKEAARALWLSSVDHANTKAVDLFLAELCDGRPWLFNDRWDWRRFVADVLKVDVEMRV